MVDRVVVTGYGVVAPGAHDRHSFKEIMQHGICVQEELKHRGPDGASIVAGIVHDNDINICKKKYRRYPKASWMAMAAAQEAVQMAQINPEELSTMSVIIGSSGGAIQEIEQYAHMGEQYRTFPLHGLAYADGQTISSSVAVSLGAKGQVFTITSGCTSSVDSIQLAAALLQTNQAKSCVVGGTDSTLGKWSSYGFFKLRAITGNQDINHTGIPFSKNSKGFVLAEGAGMLVLERESDARKRGAAIYGVIDKAVSNNSSTGLLQSSLSASEMITALQETVGEKRPDYINSQALGLEANDEIERNTYHTLFGNTMKITSIKGSIGHTFGAAGALQIISALQSIQYGFIPPTLKTDKFGFEEMNIVTETIYQPVNSAAVTTHGVGGNNSCLLVSKYE